MQKVNQLKRSSDTLSRQFEEDKQTFSESFLTGHTIRKLPNLKPDQIQLVDIKSNTSFLNLLDDPKSYELNLSLIHI